MTIVNFNEAKKLQHRARKTAHSNRKITALSSKKRRTPKHPENAELQKTPKKKPPRKRRTPKTNTKQLQKTGEHRINKKRLTPTKNPEIKRLENGAEQLQQKTQKFKPS